MKILISALLLMVFADAGAVNKCVENGKVIYQQGPCLNGTQASFEAGVSNIGSDGLRKEVAQRDYQKQKQEQEQQEALIAQENMQLKALALKNNAAGREAKATLMQRGEWSQNDEIMSKLDSIERKANAAKNAAIKTQQDAEWARIRDHKY